ncbi:MAG: GLPGLI family protein [Bacteroidetes bacterium]|nr:GLPGLI family protein [Bacteroidota bacterium]
MKNILLLFGVALCTLYHLHAQGLIVTYEESTSFQFQRQPPNLSQIDNPQMRMAVENSMRGMDRNRNMEMSKTSQLFVNNAVSEYRTEQSKPQNREESFTDERAGNVVPTRTEVTRLTTITPHTYYKDRHNKSKLTQINIDGKEYIVNEPLGEIKWKIGKKKQTVSGYQCIEATAKTADGMPITAWFTPDIPINDGPGTYWGLPGLILYVEIEGDMSRQIYSCTSIEQVDGLLSIDAPDSGEKITKAELEKMRGELIQRLQENAARRGNNSGNSGTVIIR